VREILRKHLLADAQCWDEVDEGAADELAEAAAGYLFSESGGPGALATAVLANAERREISARDVVSGALLKTVADQARRTAALRSIRHPAGDGVLVEDVLDAVDDALAAESAKLKSPPAARRLLDFHDADQIVRVEPPLRKRTPRHRFLTAA
jgi:hypothetical protein